MHRSGVATATATAVIIGQAMSRNLRTAASTVSHVTHHSFPVIRSSRDPCSAFTAHGATADVNSATAPGVPCTLLPAGLPALVSTNSQQQGQQWTLQRVCYTERP